jgi:vesicle coat complex subunit
VRSFVDHEDARVRVAVALLYGSPAAAKGSDAALSLLVADSAAEVRGAAVASLVRRGKHTLPTLTSLLRSENAVVRGVAVIGLAELVRLGHDPPRELSNVAAGDADAAVRQAARAALRGR